MRRRVVIFVLAVAAACSSGGHGYGGATEAAFMETCTHKESQPAQMCKCIYDEISRQVPFDRYVELDKQMQKDDKFVPDELVRAAADCSSRLNTTTTGSDGSSPSS
ncbi:MAG: hypothetical protein QOC92_3409 [Acidimicrobiaceae bacterium]